MVSIQSAVIMMVWWERQKETTEKNWETLRTLANHLSCNSDDKPYWVSWIRMGTKWSNNRTFVVPLKNDSRVTDAVFQVVFLALSLPPPHSTSRGKKHSWAQFDTIPKRTIYQIIDIKLMRMRLAHKWNTTTKQQNWERKKKSETVEGKPSEWSISWCFTIILWFLWTGYYVIGIYSFFFSLALFHPTVGALDYCLSAHKMCVCVFPRQFIIDIMLVSFWLCRAHVQEMWDRLWFLLYRITENWRNSVTKH